MKKLFTLLCFLLCAVLSQAQTYKPMLKPSREWFSCNWSWQMRYLNYYQLSDTTTLVNGTPYYTLKCTEYHYNFSRFIREDSAAKKVWLKIGSAPEELLYDFSLTTGDSMLFPGNEKFAVLADTLLRSFSDSSHKMRALLLQTPITNSWLVEGVGLISPSFPQQILGTDYGITEMVVPDSVAHALFNVMADIPLFTDKYDTSGFCAISLGIDHTPEQPKFILSPNPCNTGKINLQFATKLGDKLPYRITAIDGRLLQQGEAQNNTPLDVSALPKGVYLIQLTQASVPYTQRLVIL